MRLDELQISIFPTGCAEASPHGISHQADEYRGFPARYGIYGSMIRTIVITGAASGIGQALALRYARDGARLGLLDANAAGLADVSERCRALGSDVYSQTIDVRERAALGAWLEQFDDAQPIDILFANAGVISGVADGQSAESVEASFELMDINVLGILNTIHPLLPRMIGRRQGTIAITSSVAGFAPLPQMPSYGASKAALLSYGMSLRAGLRAHGVKVSVICPGYIDTPMTIRVQGTKPFVRSVEYAAEKIHRGIERNVSVIAFPWYFALVMRWGGLLPDWARQHAFSVARFSVAPKQ